MWTRHLLLATCALSSVGYVTAIATDATSTSDANFTVKGAVPAFGVGLPAGLAALKYQRSAEAAHRRQVFYLGAQYVTDPTTKFTRVVNQMYVEQLLPARGVSQPNPIVFFHGGGFTGVTWLQTPDNRQGWASYFLDKGYAVYLIDASYTARSGRASTQPVLDAAPVEITQTFFSASQDFPQTYPQAKLHTQWPGSGLKGDPAFDAWYPQAIQVPSDFASTEVAVQSATCELLSYIGSSFLVGHSYGGNFLWLAADKCPEKVQGIFGVEPDTPAFQSLSSGKSIRTRIWGLTDAPLTYDPPVTDPVAQLSSQAQLVGTDSPGNRACYLQKEPARKLVNLAKVPIYFYTTDSSIHAAYDHCIDAYLTQAGVKHTWQKLADIGIRGNGHFSFVEKNNLQLAALAEKFFKRHVGRKSKRF